jgi:hypothetical protein
MSVLKIGNPGGEGFLYLGPTWDQRWGDGDRIWGNLAQRQIKDESKTNQKDEDIDHHKLPRQSREKEDNNYKLPPIELALLSGVPQFPATVGSGQPQRFPPAVIGGERWQILDQQGVCLCKTLCQLSYVSISSEFLGIRPLVPSNHCTLSADFPVWRQIPAIQGLYALCLTECNGLYP